MKSSSDSRPAKVRTWFSDLSKINKIVITVATTIITLATLGALVLAGYNKIVDLVGPDTTKETQWLGIQVWQRGEPNDIIAVGDDPFQRRVDVPMEQEPFQLRLPAQDKNTAIQVCAWTDDSIFTLDTEEPIAAQPCVRPATGMAVTEAGAQVTLILNNEGHNYFSGDRKATTSKQEVITVQAVEPAYYVENFPLPKDAPTPLEELTEDIFLMVFINTDNDRIVDSDEYHFIRLDFSGGNWWDFLKGN